MTFYNKFYYRLGILFLVLSVVMSVIGILQLREVLFFSQESPFIFAASLCAVGAALVSGYKREMKRKAEEAKKAAGE